MAKDEKSIAAEVKVEVPPDYTYECPCGEPWVQGAMSCDICGSVLMKNILVSKKG